MSGNKKDNFSLYVVLIATALSYSIVERRNKEVDQKKIGSFFKKLRNEKGLTQEQLAEQFGVSGRTVSRWETGHNMPDLDILIEMADYYDVDMRELLNGERKGEEMEQEMKETLLQLADYSNEERMRLTKTIRRLFRIGLLSFSIYFIMLFAEPAQTTHLYDFISGVMIGIPFGTMIVGVIFTSKYASQIRAFKRRLLHGKQD